MSSTQRVGDLVWHTNAIDRRPRIRGHAHHRDHVTFCTAGWFMLRILDGEDAGKVVQLAHHLYAPPEGLRPVRFPDQEFKNVGYVELDVRWLDPGEILPAECEEIQFAPDADHFLVRAGVRHSIHTLSRDPVGTYMCMFTKVEGPDQMRPYI